MIYRANKSTVTLWIIISILLLFVYGLGLLTAIMIYVWWKNKKLELQGDKIVISEGILNREEHTIKFNKINNLKYSTGGGMIIYTGNDKPLVVNNFEKMKEIYNYVKDRID